MPCVSLSKPSSGLCADVRNIGVAYKRRVNGHFDSTSTAEKTGARQKYLGKTKQRKVPSACWDMFQAFLTESGPGAKVQAQQSYALSALILLVMEAAGCEVDVINWVDFKVQFLA